MCGNNEEPMRANESHNGGESGSLYCCSTCLLFFSFLSFLSMYKNIKVVDIK